MPFSSPFADVAIPDVTLYDYLFAELDGHTKERTALIDAETTSAITYGGLVSHIDAAAGALVARGILPGDVVGIMAPNSPEFAIVLHGALRAAATVTTINVLYTETEIASQLRDASPRFLFTTNTLAPKLREATRQAGIAATPIVTVDEPRTIGYETLNDLIDEQHSPPSVDIDPHTHTAVLPYSSGTTGRPKGVMLTHRNLVANLCQIRPVAGTAATDTVLATLPFFHIYGLTSVLNASLAARASIVTMPKFDIDTMWHTIATYRCTYLFIAPPIALAIAGAPKIDPDDVASVRTVLSGAAPLDAELARTVAKRLYTDVRQGYGMSELSPVSHVVSLDADTTDHTLSSVGAAVPNIHCKLLDTETGAEIPFPASGVSRAGELCVAGPNAMRGYLNNPDATAETIDEDGFLHTGDLVTVDHNGIITVVDRLKELIKYKGYQVPPAELEAVLLQHPDITDAAVIGIRTDSGEEVPKGIIVTRPDSTITEVDILSYVSERVAPYKKIRAIDFTERIPKSAAGKILRNELRLSHG